jgi:HD-GYP domain-containing protein (c-di-GMP phosphodiesterase class II)
MSHDDAIRVLRQNAGTQFDPEIVPLFEKIISIAQQWPVVGGSVPEFQSIQNLSAALNAAQFIPQDPLVKDA